MKSNLSILIVEDDLSFALELEMLIESIGYTTLASVDNSEQAISLATAELPNLILMDIEIKGEKNGIQVAEELMHLNIPVLYITSFGEKDNYEFANRTNSVGFLVKPISNYSLRTAIELVIKSLQGEDDTKSNFIDKNYLFFKKNKLYHKIAVHDILYIKSNGDYTTCKTHEEEFITSLPLKEYEELLIDFPFKRVHRGYLANMEKMTSFDYNSSILYINEVEIPVNRQVRQELLNSTNFLK